MSEAFEIGISLVLADGVSEGIAKAQRDAAAVSRAMSVGALSVDKLREAGVAALTVVHAVRAAGAAVVPDVLRERVDKGPVASSGVQDAGGAWLGERADAGRPMSSAGAESGIAPVVQVAGPVVTGTAAPAAEIAHGRLDLVHSIRLDRPLASPTGAVMQESDSSGAGGGPMPAPVATSVVNWLGASNPGVPAAGGADLPVRRELRLDEYGRRGIGAAGATGGRSGPSEASVPQSVPELQAGVAVAGVPYAPVLADVGPAAARPLRRSEAEGAATANDGSKARGGAEGSPGPAHGDVFLDGALVGRWMARWLSREAGRASAGPTGFDSRRNALLPGPTVGG